jgi:hypothetical protein
MSPSTRRRIGGALLTASLLVGLAVAPAAAAESVRIDLDVTFGDPVEPFTTNGAGGLCASGTAESVGFFQTPGRQQTVFHVVKVLDCGGGDSITIRLESTWRYGAPTNGGAWRIIDGSGDLAGLRGGGRQIGIYNQTGTAIHDIYTGMITGG